MEILLYGSSLGGKEILIYYVVYIEILKGVSQWFTSHLKLVRTNGLH